MSGYQIDQIDQKIVRGTVKAFQHQVHLLVGHQRQNQRESVEYLVQQFTKG